MIYSFSKDRQFLRCEIVPGQPHALTVIDPNGEEHIEHFSSTTDLEARWNELRHELTRDGWRGPFGRDARV
jgi:hypothetical protein